MQGRLLYTILGLLIYANTSAQEVLLKGGFAEDSLKLGENIHFWVAVSYPGELELILPDTTYNFSPFEFSAKSYFPGTIKNGLVSDSAIYTLQSYEIDPVQYLSLPAYVLGPKGDSITIRIEPDSIYLTELVPMVSDTTALKTNLAYQDVPTQFNFQLMWIILGVLVVILALTYIFFGKKIQKLMRLRKLRKAYIQFSEQLSLQIHDLKNAPDQKVAEHMLSEWKRFLEMLEQRPFSKLTTKEIMAMEYTAELNGTLKNIDRCVYGGHINDAIYKDFQAIEDFTQHRYAMITDQIKNG